MDTATMLGLALGILGVVIGLVTYWFSRRPKRLGYSFSRWKTLLDVTYPEVTLMFKGAQVDRPHLFQIVFRNYGKVEIRREDFDVDRPLTITLSDELVDARVISERRSQLSARIRKDAHSITIDPVLLNPGEEVVISGLASKKDPDVPSTHSVRGHIAGVPSIQRLENVGRLAFLDRPRSLLIVGPLAALVTGVMWAALPAGWEFLSLTAGYALAMLIWYLPDMVRWYRRRLFSK